MLVKSILSLAFVAFVFGTPETTSAEQNDKRAEVKELDKRNYYRPNYGRDYKRDEADEANEAKRDIDLSKRFYYGFIPYKRSDDGNEMNKRDGYYRSHYGYSSGNRYYKRDESDEAKREDGGNVEKRFRRP